MDSQAVIHFIGLVLFTTQVSGLNFQVIGIMPRVGSDSSIQRRATLRARSLSEVKLSAEDKVEEHVALMAFKPCDLLAVSGWEVKKLDDQFLYIRLNGEKINFVADGANGHVANAQTGHVGPITNRYDADHAALAIRFS